MEFSELQLRIIILSLVLILLSMSVLSTSYHATLFVPLYRSVSLRGHVRAPLMAWCFPAIPHLPLVDLVMKSAIPAMFARRAGQFPRPLPGRAGVCPGHTR